MARYNLDKNLVWLTILLSVVGLIAIADASSPLALSSFGDSFYFAKQQIKWLVIGYLCLVVGVVVDYKIWKKLALGLFVLNIVLLILVLLPGLGTKLLGARRWLSVGPFSFQPSEFTKLSLVIFLAKLLDDKERTWKALAAIGFMGLLIMLQPDLGTTLVIVGIGFVQMFVAGVPILYFLGAVLASIVALILVTLASEYRRERLLSFWQSWQDPLGSSYHLRQILLALGSGGLLGIGLGKSRQKQLFLPETASDSVFAVIAEEVGFIGAAVLVVLLALFVVRIFRIARQAPDPFSGILTTGIATWFGTQMLLNIASNVALVPITGIPLPFFSYGGSSIVMILFAIGILLNISSNTKSTMKR